MPVEQTPFINQAIREYQHDSAFRVYADEIVQRLRAHEPSLFADTMTCFALLMETGEALGKVVLEGYQRRADERLRQQPQLMSSTRRRRIGGL